MLLLYSSAGTESQSDDEEQYQGWVCNGRTCSHLVEMLQGREEKIEGGMRQRERDLSD